MKKAFSLLALAGACFALHAEDLVGDAAAGKTKASTCLGCHSIPGYQASFPEVHKVPMIAGQVEKYLETALGEYQKGERKHPTMRAVAASLSPQDMADLATFFSTLAPPVAKQPVTSKPSASAEQLIKAGNCTTCHGQDFSTPIAPTYPKLAGQHADYLYTAVRAYMVENNAVRGRSHPIMSGAIKGASASVTERELLAELRALTDYISNLPGDLKTVPESRWR